MLFFRLKTPLFNNVKYLDIFSPNLHSIVNILVSKDCDKYFIISVRFVLVCIYGI